MPVEPQLLAAWCALWSRSRGLSAPRWEFGALRTLVGLPEQKERWVFPRAGDDVRRLVARTREAGILVKVCATEAEVAPLLRDGWGFGMQRFFMTAALERASPAEIEGYDIGVAEEPWGVLATVTTSDGTLTGRAGLLLEGELATIDRLTVEESHRSRGIGGAIVALLHEEAIRRGAVRGALVATEAGRPLYEQLGWIVLSDYVTAQIGA